MTKKFKNQYRYLLVVVLCQIVFFVVWYGLEASKIKNPKNKTIIVKVLPVDPRDIISGNYFDLRYNFSFIASFKHKFEISKDSPNKIIYAVLTKQDQDYFADYLAFEMPKVRENQVVLKGTYDQVFLRFGIEKYFITEKFSPPKFEDLIEAEIVVEESGEARIKRLFINSKAIE